MNRFFNYHLPIFLSVSLVVASVGFWHSQQAKATAPTDFVAGYKLDDANDSSSNAYNLTNNGTVTFGTGKIGNAAQFGNSNSSKSLTIASNLGITSSYSVCYWGRDADNNAQSMAVELIINSGTKGFRAIRDAVNQRWGILFNNNFTFSSVGDGLANNVWRFICVVNDAGSATMYIDTVSTLTSNSTGSFATSNQFNISQNSSGEYQSGDIDAVYVYDYALNTTQISDLYNSGTGVEPSAGGGGAAATPAIFFSGD